MGEGNRVGHCGAWEEDEALCFAHGLTESPAVFALAHEMGEGEG